MQTSDKTNQMLYDQLLSQLADQFPSIFGFQGNRISDALQFQFCAPGYRSAASWVNRVQDVNFEIQELFLGDKSPDQKLGLYSAGETSPSIYEHYKLWINSVSPFSGSHRAKSQLEAKQHAMNKAIEEKHKILCSATPEFQAWKQQEPENLAMSVRDWTTMNPSAAKYAPQLRQFDQVYDAHRKQSAAIVKDVNTPLYRAQKAANDPAYKSTYQYTSGSQKISVSAGTTSIGGVMKSPSQDWTDWISGTTTSANYQNMRIGLPVPNGVKAMPAPSAFFRLPAMDEMERRTFVSELFSPENEGVGWLELHCGSVSIYSVSRSGWFSLSALETYMDKPYHSAFDFFNAENGSLYLIPSHVVLAWNVAAALIVPDEMFAKWQKSLLSPRGLEIVGIPTGSGKPPVVQDRTHKDRPVKQLLYGDMDRRENQQQVPWLIGLLQRRQRSSAKQ